MWKHLWLLNVLKDIPIRIAVMYLDRRRFNQLRYGVVETGKLEEEAWQVVGELVIKNINI